MLAAFAAVAGAAESPAIVIHSDAYRTVGASNSSSILLGSLATGTYTVTDARGTRDIDVIPASINSETGDWEGTWESISVPSSGLVTISGDAANLDVIVADGCGIETIDFPGCKNLEILSLEHNSLKKLDLTPFTGLRAIYLSDNSFTEATPLVVGAPKPGLQILELDIIDHLDQSFNLSDYPALITFDGYHNRDLYRVDPSGCPDLAVLSLELTNVSELDVSANLNLLRLNIAETRITSIDLSHNAKLEHFLGSHDSGTINNTYRLSSIDLSHNPALTILSLNGNGLESIDLSNNVKLTNLSLQRNLLTRLDLSANTDLASVWIMDNDMDFATLPEPKASYSEYFYRQNALRVPRSIGAGAELDLSSRVLREGTTTVASVMRQVYDGEDEALPASDYVYANGVIKFPNAISDSVYVVYANTMFDQYPMKTTPFMVKDPSELGKPSKVLSVTCLTQGEINFSAGLYGATAESPKTFYTDFGDGTLVPCTAGFALGGNANVTGNVTGSGVVSIYIPEGEVLTSFSLADMPLMSADLTKATELIELSLTGTNLAKVDLRYNRCLQSLRLDRNRLSELDLAGIYGDYEKNVLADISAASNRLESFNNMTPGATRSLDLSGNKLAELSLKDYDNLQTLDLSGNQLVTASLEYLGSALSVDLSDNLLTEVSPCSSALIPDVDLAGNRLNFTTLPLPEAFGEGYSYAPQQEITIPAEAPAVNLTAYLANRGGNVTEVAVRKTDGTLLVSGTDYEKRGGIFTFLKDDLGEVRFELTNATYPLMSGDNALRTTATHVIGMPSEVVATFTPTGLSEESAASMIFAATGDTQLYIDWSGDATELVPCPVTTTPTEYTVSNLTTGANARILAASKEDVASLRVFSIYGITLKEADFTPLTGLTSLNLGYCSLSPDKLKMPEAPNLTELTLVGNRFKEYPYAKKYPGVKTLNLGVNRFESFDGSIIPNVEYLVLSGNRLSDVTFDNPALWSLFIDNNELSGINLNGLPKLEQLLLQSNRLAAIDLSPVIATLHVLSLVDNQFTFATLPFPDDYPELNVYYYGNQAPLTVECVDMKVDLSAQADVHGTETQFSWYRGIPSYDSETGEITGDLLTEGTDYTLEKGVTTFLAPQDEDVLCVMLNEEFPNLTLITMPLTIKDSGVEETGDADRMVDIYRADGVKVRTAPARIAAEGLAPGLYIIGGRKVLIK